MPSYEVQSEVKDFAYQVWCSHQPEGWRVDGVTVLRLGVPVLPRRRLSGIFLSEADAVDRAIHWCDVIAKHLTTAEVPETVPLAPREIAVDQAPPEPGKDVA